MSGHIILTSGVIPFVLRGLPCGYLHTEGGRVCLNSDRVM